MAEFKTLSSDMRALVVGASGGIGYALTMALGNICGMGNVVPLSRSADELDIRDEESIRRVLQDLEGPFDIIIVATGALEIDGTGPEKTLMAMTPEALRSQFETNALGPALLIKHLHGLLPQKERGVLAVLSARVGSIGDNHKGGWISYRTAKAALNQIVRTAALEIALRRKKAICVALHPGTVRTDLTRKYAVGYETVMPEMAAENLLKVIDGLHPKDNGRFFDWQGKAVEW